MVVDDLDAVDGKDRRVSRIMKREGLRPSRVSVESSVLLGAVARRDALLLRVLGGRGLRSSARSSWRSGCIQSVITFHLLPSHCLELHRAAALVVHARDLSGCIRPAEPSCFRRLLVDGQVLEAPAHLLAGDRLALAELGLRAADRLDGDACRRRCRACTDRADVAPVLAVALALVVDVLERCPASPGSWPAGRLKPARCSPWRLRPPGSRPARRRTTTRRISSRADSRSRGFLERGGVHHAPAPQDHVVGRCWRICSHVDFCSSPGCVHRHG